LSIKIYIYTNGPGNFKYAHIITHIRSFDQGVQGCGEDFQMYGFIEMFFPYRNICRFVLKMLIEMQVCLCLVLVIYFKQICNVLSVCQSIQYEI